uniref:Uncharacterized protein n=1 Tax=Oryza nivara TaxID=4536 RepID=A0A0E0J7R0_ORYNI
MAMTEEKIASARLMRQQAQVDITCIDCSIGGLIAATAAVVAAAVVIAAAAAAAIVVAAVAATVVATAAAIAIFTICALKQNYKVTHAQEKKEDKAREEAPMNTFIVIIPNEVIVQIRYISIEILNFVPIDDG